MPRMVPDAGTLRFKAVRQLVSIRTPNDYPTRPLVGNWELSGSSRASTTCVMAQAAASAAAYRIPFSR